MFSFTEKKFLSLDTKKQHKVCFQILKQIYDLFLKKKNYQSLFIQYNQIMCWMNKNSLKKITFNSLSDRYHEHIKFSKYNLKEYNLLPTISHGDKKAKKNFGQTCIYLDNLRSAHNVGSILRTVEALRLGKVYFSPSTPYIDNKKVIKTAMRAAEIVPCYKAVDIKKTLPKPFIGLETSTDAIEINDFIFPQQCTLIVGNEEYGISDAVLKQINYLLYIPLYGIKNSLNVACSFAIAAMQIAKN